MCVCICVCVYIHVHIFLCGYVYDLKQQASGFNHMQNVITLSFPGHICGQEMDLVKKWTIYSPFQCSRLKRKMNRWKQERHLGL